MFPPSNASIDRNEAGEPTGWDVPGEIPFCDRHGAHHEPGGLTCEDWDAEEADDDEDDELDDDPMEGMLGHETDGIDPYENEDEARFRSLRWGEY